MSAVDYPIAVVGGGIAGIAACLRLLKKGINPLWIAAPSVNLDKPGEHLSPAARPLLEEISAHKLLDNPLHRAANSLLSAWGSDQLAERDAIVHLEGPGTVLNRRIFEQELEDKLMAEPGISRIESPLLSAKKTADHWLLSCENNRQLSANFVIDATGRHAIVAKQHSARFRADQLVAAISWLEQAPDSDIEPTNATLIEAVAGGWWYAALLADGRLALNYYSDPDLLPTDISRKTGVMSDLLSQSQYIGRWVEEAGFRIQGPAQLASVGTTWIAPAAGADWLAVGDAAAAFDPLSSHGMTTALWTALQGADAAAASLQGDSQPAQTYNVKVAEGVQEFLNSSTQVYAQETRFSEHAFWQRRVTT